MPVVDAFALRDVGLNVVAGAGTPAEHVAIQVELLAARPEWDPSIAMIMSPLVQTSVAEIAGSAQEETVRGKQAWQ